MPVTCINKLNEKLISFDFSDTDWKMLKSQYQELGLHMRCCGSSAIPKTSKLGTKFFAHKTDACGTEGESTEHLRCKELIVEGAKNSNWSAFPEEAGNDKHGNSWVADVLCTNNENKIAFEVQLASQTFDEYKRRTERYNNSGVKCLWLIKRKRRHPIAEQMILDRIKSTNRNDVLGHHPDREDMPVFQVDVSDINKIMVFFPWHHGKGPYHVPLVEFINGFLNGRITFSEGRWYWSA